MTVAQAVPRLIGRGDLVAALDRAAASKVTIISAPAGSGKTSLLRAWAGRPGQAHRLALVQVQRDQRLGPESWHQHDRGQIGHDDEAAAPRQERILQACRMMCWLSTVMSFSLTVRSTDSGMLRSGREAVIGS